MIKLKHLSLAVLSAVLLSIPWITGFSFTIFISLVPLFYLKDFFLKFKRNGTFPFWVLSFVAFFIWNVVVSSFIAKVSFLSALSLWIINAFLMSLVWYLSFLYDTFSAKKASSWFLIALWISFEFLQYNWDFEWPWFTLGNSLSSSIDMVQWYQYTGVFGGSLWVIVLNIAFYSIVKIRIENQQNRIGFRIMTTLILLLIPVFISLHLKSHKVQSGSELSVLLVQPNIDPYTEKFDGLSVEEQYQRFIDLTTDYKDSTIDIIVGPETFLHRIDELELKENGHFFIDSIHSKFPESTIVIGASTFITDSFKTSKYYNSALVCSNNEVAIYHKKNLVSGVEKMPFQRILKLFGDLVFINLGGVDHFLSNETSDTIFNLNNVSIVTPICYEALFGEYCSKLINGQGALMITVTNDGWWKGTTGYQQHLELSKIRCIENGVYMIRAANTGISAIINDKGEIIKESEFGIQETIYGNIKITQADTYYSKHGDYIARMLLFLFVLLFGKWMVERKIKPH